MAYRIHPLAAAIGLAFSSTTLCSIAVAAETAQLNDVVVTASKTEEGAKPGTLGTSDIAPRRAVTSDTASLLQDLPGVSLYSAGGVSSLPVIHGLADDRLRIKVDGMDLLASCPNHMNPALSYIDPTQVEVAKVYAGITPVSVGGDSIGGTIIVDTKAPKFARPGQGMLTEGEIGAFYRSNNDANGVNASATLATENFSLTYSGATSQANNYTAGGNFKTSTATGRVGHTLPLDEVGSTAYKTTNHNLGLAFKHENHLIEAKIGIQDMPYQLYPNQRMDLLNNEQQRFNLRYLGNYNWGKLEARAYHEEVDHFMDFGADKRYWYGTGSGGPAAINGAACAPAGTAACANGMPMYTASKTDGFNLKGELALNQHDVLRLGSEYQLYQLNDWWPASGGGMMPGTFWNIHDGERERTAMFGEWEGRLTPQLAAVLGLRYERVSTQAGEVRGYSTTAVNQTTDANAFNARDRKRTDNNWDLTALARYTVNPNYDVEFGFARKTRSPNLYERYTWSTWQMAALMNNYVGDGNGYVGDINLAPEKAHTVSTTFDWHAPDRRWELKASPFFTRVTDYIDAVRLDPANANGAAFDVLRYTNQSARLYGIDLSGRMPLAETSLGELGLRGLLNYTNGKNRDTGDDLYNIMPLNAKLILTQKFAGWDNAVELVMVKRKNHVADQRNEIETPGYNLLNLRGSYSWKQVRFDFGVENLFDKAYYQPLGGAYVGQGTTMTTTAAPTGSVPQMGTAVPGMGRSLYAGINVKF